MQLTQLILLAACLLAAPWATAAEPAESAPTPALAAAQAEADAQKAPFTPPPWATRFARGGQKTRVSLEHASWATREVVLTAFGRTWSKPAKVARSSLCAWAYVVMPKVRVPTLFTLTATDVFLAKTQYAAGTLVVYPDEDVAWDDQIAVLAFREPAWFRQWAKVIGLPVTSLMALDALRDEVRKLGEGRQAILVLGHEYSFPKKGPDVLAQLTEQTPIPIVVLETHWLEGGSQTEPGPPAAEAATFGSDQVGGDLLAAVGRQQWPEKLWFHAHRRPWPGIANRWAWITGTDGLPLVEDLAMPSSKAAGTPPPHLVLSYLPWTDQLGRSESADAMLLALLKAAARPRESMPQKGADLLYPAAASVVKDKDRPVLRCVPWGGLVSYYVLDLRGPAPAPANLPARCELSLSAPRDIAPLDGLLILGDDPILDAWKGLRFNREKGTFGRADVVWLKDDELPPSPEAQLRLMLKLTELGVPLMPPKVEEERK